MKINQMEFGYDILKTFIPEDKLKSFLVFENVYLVGGNTIFAPYRAPFTEKLTISISDYNKTLNQKLREEKLNSLL